MLSLGVGSIRTSQGPTGAFAMCFARRSRSRHFQTRVWSFHAHFTPPRARTSTTTSTKHNCSAASPPGAGAPFVDELATLGRLQRPELLRRPDSAFTRPTRRSQVGTVGTGRERRQRRRRRRRRWSRRRRRGGGGAEGGSAASAGCDEGLGPVNGNVENFAGLALENSPEHEVENRNTRSSKRRSAATWQPFCNAGCTDRQSTLRIWEGFLPPT